MYPVIRAKNRGSEMLQKVYVPEGCAISQGFGETDVVNEKKQTAYEVAYLQFPKLAENPRIKHLFSTRLGGVSKGHLGTMNFSYTRGDAPENVLENFRRIGRVLGYPVDRFVATHQTHTTNIRVVTEEDAGKGIVRERDYSDIDGLITNVKGLVLTGFYADCVPLYFWDPVQTVIGVAHSGWRGTAAGMGARMVETMQQVYGCQPEDIIAAIGPSICQECYEISEEVCMGFWQGFWAQEHVQRVRREICGSGASGAQDMILPGKETGKYQLDLWLANQIVLQSAGIRPENIEITDICTCCNPEYLYSHRASKGLRGNLAAFLVLNEE